MAIFEGAGVALSHHHFKANGDVELRQTGRDLRGADRRHGYGCDRDLWNHW